MHVASCDGAQPSMPCAFPSLCSSSMDCLISQRHGWLTDCHACSCPVHTAGSAAYPSSTHKETKNDFLEGPTFGDIIYQNFIFDIPKVFDIITLWAPANPTLVAKMVGNLFKQQPGYYDDFEQTVQTILEVFTMTASTASAKMNVAQATDLLAYTIDISATIYWFLQVCPEPALDVLIRNEMLLHFANFYESVIPAIEKTFKGDGSIQRLSAAKTKVSTDDQKQMETSKLWLTMAAQNLLQCCYARQAPSSATGSDANIDLCSVLDRVFECENFVADWSNSRPMVGTLKELASLNGIDPMRLEYFVSVAEKLLDADNELHAAAEASLLPSASQSMDSFSTTSASPSTGADSDLTGSIAQVKGLFPDLGDGFVEACLKELTNPEVVIDKLLDNSLPPSLRDLPRDLPRPQRNATPVVQAAMVPGPLTQKFRKDRHNIFDGDEFDLFSGKAVDLSRINQGKKQQENTLDFLNDKSAVRANFNVAIETQYTYEDEYDDTYDDMGGFDTDAKTETLLQPNLNHQVTTFPSCSS